MKTYNFHYSDMICRIMYLENSKEYASYYNQQVNLAKLLEIRHYTKFNSMSMD